MTHSLNEPFFKWLQSPSGNLLLGLISQYPSLSLNLSGNFLKVYFDGMLILSVPSKISSDENTKLIPLSGKYGYENERMLNDLISDGVKLATLHDYLGSVIAFLSRRDNRRQEERIRQEIVFENNRSRIANDTDYFVVAQEYAISGKEGSKTSKFDLVAVKWTSSSASRKNFTPADIDIVVFELKYGLRAVGGSKSSSGKKADLKCHINDFTNCLLKDYDACEKFKYDIIRMFVQQVSLTGFLAPDIDGLKHVRKLNTEADIKEFAAQVKVKFGFILADYKSASSLLQEQVEMFDDDFLFATGSYLGYGLYERFMLNRKTLLERLKCI